jgi:hypothetical protein
MRGWPPIKAQIAGFCLTHNSSPRTLKTMNFRNLTSVLLVAMLSLPSIPVVADCGCGGHSSVDDRSDSTPCCQSTDSTSCCETEQRETKSCCASKPTSVAVGCCGKSGDACQCSDSPDGCQCGLNCQCGDDSEPPAEEPTSPPSESESDNLVSQVESEALLVAVLDDINLIGRSAVPSQSDFDCCSSTERCIKLCRFLR